ncbi:thioredoxin domain-containing protein [Candidatus Saccharibacteria bacterium]|nr:thioredoxin domain-containing protein [Candidatus Saccharibacteria bacterium]
MKKALLVISIIIFTLTVIALIASAPKPDENFSADSIIEASSRTGNLPEKIIGDPDLATLIIYEYADYACPHCSDFNDEMNALLEKYGDRLALVFRSYDLGLSKNSQSASRAATAAEIQGCWKEYKDLLFKHQSEWVYADNKTLNELLLKYFERASSGAGDTEKFKNDMKSSEVKKRVDFEQKLGKSINLKGTPTFRANGEDLPLETLSSTIESLMK